MIYCISHGMLNGMSHGTNRFHGTPHGQFHGILIETQANSHMNPNHVDDATRGKRQEVRGKSQCTYPQPDKLCRPCFTVKAEFLEKKTAVDRAGERLEHTSRHSSLQQDRKKSRKLNATSDDVITLAHFQENSSPRPRNRPKNVPRVRKTSMYQGTKCR